MRVLGLITARGGSKGIPGKNIKSLAGRPLLSFVAEDGRASKQIDRFIISTDDPDIALVARECGVEVPFMRPMELALDTTPSINVVKHALGTLEEMGDSFDAVCLLQPTSPFKPSGFIDRCITRFKETEADCLISVLQVPHEFNPHWVFEEGEEGLLNIATGEEDLIPRRQDLPPAYYRDGSVYVFKKENPLNHSSLVRGKVSFMLSDKNYYCNLDTLDDWKLAEEKVESFLRNK